MGWLSSITGVRERAALKELVINRAELRYPSVVSTWRQQHARQHFQVQQSAPGPFIIRVIKYDGPEVCVFKAALSSYLGSKLCESEIKTSKVKALEDLARMLEWRDW
ncbi:uncharacterized protein MYCFIDRAFT_211324 [Pseudocercospora fijiensis CIRAD86]|uniref:Uncharacterized protein n=1 Tax=Pseudocercospora fijiensis (strain CIRAD86) TaxID=383855 RepID=M3B201_PSEFD|nr:uncharacterized protein MYCFIDRAFT_211324 [Pseudocercospora fijiensis CIRAD86]EME83398.1 hypothetical protein MYCFIDRAFT_211324 [Pseudocercospora fijiensis CIRAD86]